MDHKYRLEVELSTPTNRDDNTLIGSISDEEQKGKISFFNQQQENGTRIIYAHGFNLKRDSKQKSEHVHNDHASLLLGIPLPIEIVEEIEDLLEQHRDDVQTLTEYMNEILSSKIHSSFLQVNWTDVVLLKRLVKSETDFMQNTIYAPVDMLVLKLAIDEQECTRETIASFVTCINGKAMASAPSCVIQILPLTDLHVVNGSITSSSTTIQLPTCPVCRYRIRPEFLGLPNVHSDDLCTHEQSDACCRNMPFLEPWILNSCKACQLLQKRLELSGAQPFIKRGVSRERNTDYESTLEKKLQCYMCGMMETLWMCLTCGLVGCGRYSCGHAEKHYLEERHPFSLELATQRIWDYETSSFIQRDDLLSCPFMQQILGAVNRAAYHGAAICDEEVLEMVGVPPKKTVMIGEQYEALLQSALEDQALHYEGEISHLQADLASQSINVGQISEEDMKEIESLEKTIEELRANVDDTSRKYVEAQAEEAEHRTKANTLLKEQALSKQILDKLREDFEQEKEAGSQLLEDMEQQISDICANIRIRNQIANDKDLREADIFGTSSASKPKQSSKSRKKAMQRAKRK